MDNLPSKTKFENENFADDVARRVVDMAGKTRPVQKIRNSQIISAMLGAAGLALFLVGVEKVFSQLSGWTSIIIGLVLLAVSGALLTKLK
jgi:hypothetical protein